MKLDRIYIKRETVKGRTFRIEIYDECGLPYTCITEELRPKKNIFDFGYENEIDRYWISDGSRRLEVAAQKIADFLEEDEAEENFKKILDKWADEVI